MSENLIQSASNLRLGDVTSTNANQAEGANLPVAHRIIDRGHYLTRDITKEFSAASKALRSGQLVKHETFTLFESVSALEIMDPKMDSGMFTPNEDSEDHFDEFQTLLPEEVLGIMDQIFCFEMAWLEGYPLSQTIFTSLHIDRILDSSPKTLGEIPAIPEDLSNPERTWNHIILRSYCLGVIKTCELILRLITAQHQEFYDEEDFVKHTCNRELFPDVETIDFISGLNFSIEYIAEQYGRENPIYNAIKDRLVTRLMTLEGLYRCFDILPLNEEVKFQEIWKVAREQVQQFQHDHQLSKSVPDAFSGKVQRKLASTVPPKPVIEKKFDDATKQFMNLCGDILSAHLALQFQEDDTSEDVLTFLWDFNSRVPQPNTLARAVLQNLLFGTDRVFGVWAVEELIVKELQEYILVNDWFIAEENWLIEAPNHPRYQAARLVDEFLGYAVPSYCSMLRALCQNRCRLRRNFQHVIQDFDKFEERAESIDIILRNYANEKSVTASEHANNLRGLCGQDIPPNTTPLRTWVQFTKTRVMEWFLQLGFEQDLYKPHELANLYQILTNISFVRISNIDTAVNLINIHADRIPRNDRDAQNVLLRRRINGSMRVLESSLISELASALFSLYTILLRLSIIECPPYPYSNDELRIAIRLKPFKGLNAQDVLGGNPFEMGLITSKETNAELFALAQTAVLRQRKLNQSWKMVPESGGCRVSKSAWDKEHKAVKLSFVATSVALAKLQKAIDTWGEKHAAEHISVSVPAVEQRYHPWWIVPVITDI